ncbi:MAG: hypothetical protein Fur0023_09490 [Bacteroidia bacterium]
MKHMKKSLIFVSLLLIQLIVFAQQNSCKLYLYSEFDNYDLYIDDVFKGKNVKSIDSMECGEHYVKVIYEDIVVFSEIISFGNNELKKLLLKKTKDVEEKILSAKSKEIAEYRRKKISIGIDKKYITTTNVALNQYTYKPLYGNYYGLNYSGNISGIQFSESEEKITDWFFVEGGYVRMSDYEFIANYCQLTGNCEKYMDIQKRKEYIDAENKKIEKINKRRMMWSGILAVVFVFGFLSLLWGFLELLVPLILNDVDMAINIFIGGLVFTLIGLFGLGIKFKHLMSLPDKLLSLREALKMIDEYNLLLKKKLNLPESVD